jgi:hypothetical protein
VCRRAVERGVYCWAGDRGGRDGGFVFGGCGDFELYASAEAAADGVWVDWGYVGSCECCWAVAWGGVYRSCDLAVVFLGEFAYWGGGHVGDFSVFAY